jgi:protein gp37
MADNSSIEWTDATWSPTTGCDRVSPGCDHCYALTLAARLKKMGSAKYQTDGDPRTSGPGFGVAVHPDSLDLPLRWRKPRRIFVNSMSDLFHDKVPDEFIARVFATMWLAHEHTFQVLTKRHGRMRSLLSRPEFPRMVLAAAGVGPNWHPDKALGGGTLTPSWWPLRNVWLGTSIESDQWAIRAHHLRQTPAAVRFVSTEPLLGPLPSLDLTGIDWLIAGGESGPHARPMHPDWVRSLRDRCVAVGVSFFFKQWGQYLPVPVEDDPTFSAGRAFNNPIRGGRSAAVIRARSTTPFGRGVTRPMKAGDKRGDGIMLDDNTFAIRATGKAAAGRELDGRTWDEYPEVAR